MYQGVWVCNCIFNYIHPATVLEDYEKCKTERSDNSDSIITKVVVQVAMHMILQTSSNDIKQHFTAGVNSPAVEVLPLIYSI